MGVGGDGTAAAGSLSQIETEVQSATAGNQLEVANLRVMLIISLTRRGLCRALSGPSDLW